MLDGELFSEENKTAEPPKKNKLIEKLTKKLSKDKTEISHDY